MTAESLLDAGGVNTHFPYPDTPYARQFEPLCAKLKELGMRHIRDGGPVKHNKDPRYMDKIWARWLAQPCDILYVLAPHEVPDETVPGTYKYRPNYQATDIALIQSKLGAKVVAWEGLNEPDLKLADEHKVRYPDWAERTRLFQLAAFRDNVPPRPLLIPALGRPASAADYLQLGFDLWRSGTAAAAHLYSSNQAPDNPRLKDNLKLFKRFGADLPMWVTECGYDTAGPSSDQSVTEEQQAAYLLQTLVLHDALGIKRTFIYELVDQQGTYVTPEVTEEDPEPAPVLVKVAPGRENNLGLLRNDLSEKPAFTLLKGLIKALKAA